MATTMTATKTRDPLGEMRQDRDRFVALAFSAADMLVELDRDGAIVFTAGATGALLGADTDSLLGRRFLELVSAADRPMVREALVGAAGRRIDGLACQLEGQFGPTPPLQLLGYQVPDLDRHYFLGLRLGANAGAQAAPPAEAPKTETGLPAAGTFAEMAGARLAQLSADADCKLTMLRLGDIEALRGRLDVEKRGALAVAIGGVLRASAVGGELAGEIDPGNLGLVHAANADLDALARRIEDVARNADPEQRGIAVAHASVALDGAHDDPREAAQALTYIFSKFAESDPDEFSIASLNEGLNTMMAATKSRISDFQGVLKAGAFDIAFQPVVDLVTERPHHFEALARFKNLPEGKSPYETINFAEQTGLIRQFDLAMCARVLKWLDHANRGGQGYRIAVNLSGTSIASKSFVMDLHRLLKQFRGQADRLLFEITESAKIKDLEAVNGTVQSLRKAGHKVCLDDFGAGSAAFQYLRDLQVDVVKIDGAYVKGALETEKGMAFLRAMTGLCADLGIATVAEMVEDRKTLEFLRECGVAYGQGYLFGKPSFNIGSFDTPWESDVAVGHKRVPRGLK